MDSYMLLLEATITACADDFRNGSACAVGGYHFNGTATVRLPQPPLRFASRAASRTRLALALQCWVTGPDLIEQIWFCLSNFQEY